MAPDAAACVFGFSHKIPPKNTVSRNISLQKSGLFIIMKTPIIRHHIKYPERNATAR